MFKNLKLGTKIIAGYLLLIAFVALTGTVGYWGTKTVARSLYVVGNEEAPLVDMANEMKISLITARNTLEEYKGATAALATDNAAILGDLEKKYQQTLDDFDTFAEAILEGKTLEGGNVVIKTDNQELARLVRQSDDIHNTKFQVAAAEMMQAGKDLLARKAEADKAMEEMEEVFDEMTDDAAKVQQMVIAEIAQRSKGAQAGTGSQVPAFSGGSDTESASSGANVQEAWAILREEVPLANLASEIKFIIAETRIPLEEFIQMTDVGDLDPLQKKYESKIEDFDQCVQAILKGGVVDGVTIVATDNDEIRAAIEEMDDNHEEFQNQSKILMARHRAAIVQAARAEAAMEDLDAAGDEADELLGKVEGLASDEMSTAKAEGARAVTTSITWIIVSLVAAVGIGMLTGILLTRGITKPFMNMFKGLKSFSTAELEDTGKTFRQIIAGLNAGAEQTSSAAGQISSGSQALAQGTTEQAASLEEVTASIEEMASMIRQNAGNANEAKTLADAASEAMGRMSQGIADIKKSSDETAKIIKTIDEIAFQTNMLALNAAVEAARAGEAGKGFAVVAEEVRNLAQRSAEAARNTAEMIEDSVKNADNGVAITKEIAESNKNVNDLVGEIAAASNEQSQGAEQISTAVSQMDQVTQSSAANAEESASAAEELSAQAEELNRAVQELQVLIDGDDSVKRSASQVTKKHLDFQVDQGTASRVHKALHSQKPSPKAHKEAASDSKKSADQPAPEEVIPMDDDKELAKF